MENPNQLTYRPATLADLKIILELQQQAFKPVDHLKPETLRRLLHNKQNTIIFDLIETEQLPIGFAIFFTRSNSKKIRLYYLCISTNFSGRGFGFNYLQQRIASLANDFESISLEVRVSNLPAYRLYQKLGFKIVKKLPAYYDDQEDGYRMIKKIL
ncbi:MAG TPA: N-acetyltransferase [Bacillota bacterium]|jgi:ribosomal-protein-alanine N-acetyltransferase|nr:N-acetyltransferase [Bacillota bacterium]HOL11155.1 N-acetyltransferase [Bacillota bacterium]HPO97313.1 N-acetyltransferase [Bacillota bacterium]